MKNRDGTNYGLPIPSSPSAGSAERLQPPDLGRGTTPIHAAEQIITIVDPSSSPAGTPIASYGAGVWAGKVAAVADGTTDFTSVTYTPYTDVWVVSMANPAAKTLVVGNNYIAHFIGTYTLNGSARPTFVIGSSGGTRIVAPWSSASSPTPYDPVAQVANCLYPGKVYPVQSPTDGASGFYCTKPFGTAQDCWLMVLNGIISSGATKQLHHGDNYVGTYLGTWTISGDQRPVYAMREDDPQEWVTPYDSSGSTVGKPIAVNASGLIPGHTLKWDNISADYTTTLFGDGYPCWLYVIDNPGGNDTSGLTLPFGERYIARFLGVTAVSGDTRPVFGLSRKSAPPIFVQPYTGGISARSGLTLGSGSAYLVSNSGATLTVTAALLTVYNSNTSAISQYLKDGVTAKVLQAKYIGGVPVIDTDDCN